MKEPTGAKPRKPPKPTEPKKQIEVDQVFTTDEEDFTILDFKAAAVRLKCKEEELVLHVAMDSDYYGDDSYLLIRFEGPSITIDNPHYDKDLLKYDKKFAKYLDRMAEYNVNIKPWNAWDMHTKKMSKDAVKIKELALLKELKAKYPEEDDDPGFGDGMFNP